MIRKAITCDRKIKHKVDNGHYDSTKVTNIES